MYNKLYTYVHEIFLSTTIITFNYNYSWNFFTVMRERRGLRAKEWLRTGSIWWRQPRFSVFGARRKYGAKTQVRATRAVKKGGGERRREAIADYKIKKTRYPVKNYAGKFTKIYCTISPAGKRSFGKNLTIVETKFLNNIYRNARREELFFSSFLAPIHLLTQFHKIFFKNKYSCFWPSSFCCVREKEREKEIQCCESRLYVQIYT